MGQIQGLMFTMLNNTTLESLLTLTIRFKLTGEIHLLYGNLCEEYILFIEI